MSSSGPKKPTIDTGKDQGDNKKDKVETVQERVDRIKRFKEGGNKTRPAFNATKITTLKPSASTPTDQNPPKAKK